MAISLQKLRTIESPSQSFFRAWTAERAPQFAIGKAVRRPLPGGDSVTLPFVSQRWRGAEWRHELRLYRPAQVRCPTALLFLSGGDRSAAPAHRDEGRRLDGELTLFTAIARQTGSVVGVLSHTLHQPMFGGLGENALIAHTFDRFMRDGDDDWPILVPMTAAVRRAMDVAQQLSAEMFSEEIALFTLAGFSKRAWAAWLASVDPRIAGIAPIMMDFIDLPRQIAHQRHVWGGLSAHLAPFAALGLPENLASERGKRLLEMVDPVRWPDQGTVARLVTSASNDDYTPVDAPNLYLNRFAQPVPWSLIPNSRHGSMAFTEILAGVAALHRRAIGGPPLPVLTGAAEAAGGKIYVSATSDVPPVGARIWVAHGASTDLRECLWSSHPLDGPGRALPYPEEGVLALFVQADYGGGHERFSLATRVATFPGDRHR